MPLKSKVIGRYCTVTMLPLFAAIDGLGGLLHARDDASSRDRIIKFLEYMGDGYSRRKKELVALRGHLLHNAISAEAYLSHSELGDGQHLKRIGEAGFIYVNTSVMYKDVVDAFRRFRTDVTHDSAMLKRAAERLDWRTEDSTGELDSAGVPTPSPAPPVRFIQRRRRSRR